MTCQFHCAFRKWRAAECRNVGIASIASLVCAAFLLAMSPAAAQQNEQTSVSTGSAAPNVIVIVSDDQGWADVGFNNDAVYSPNLDRLANEGRIFKQHYVMPQCTPTRVALFTGRYPGRFGNAGLAANNNPVFPLGTQNLATLFQRAGYRTHLVGKWHMGSSPEYGPNKFGFDHSYGSLAGAVGMYDHRYRTGKFEHTWHRDLEPIEGGEKGTHATDLVTDEAIRVVQTESDDPFFMYLAYHAVHTPLDERGEFVDRPTQLDPQQKDRWLNEKEIRWFNDPEGKIQNESDPEKRLLLAAVYHLDEAIGRLVKALDDSGKRDNTLIMFTSDNGPQGSWGGNAYPDDLKLTNFNQKLPFRGMKTDVWEGGIHVPGFANWPAKIQPGEILEEPTHVIDWLPTFAELLEVDMEQVLDPSGPRLDGLSILPSLVEGKPIEGKRELYWIWSTRTNRWALRYGDWKIVHYGKEQPQSPEDWQLFNLANDPAESSDQGERNSEIRADLHQRFLIQRSKDKAGKK